MYVFATVVAAIGAIIGLGKLLQSGEKLTLRLAIGRGITTAALSVIAFAIMAWMPEIDPIAVVGISVFLASVGESELEKLVNTHLAKGKS